MTQTDMELLVANRVLNRIEFGEAEQVSLFKERLTKFREEIETGGLKRLKIVKHCAAILDRLVVTTKLNQDTSYSELRKAISPPLRNKFEIAVVELRKAALIQENIKFGKCYYRLNWFQPL